MTLLRLLARVLLGAALIVLHRWRVHLTHTDAFGLDSDRDRAVRLLFQSVLVVWALWSTGAWAAWRRRRREGESHVRA